MPSNQGLQGIGKPGEAALVLTISQTGRITEALVTCVTGLAGLGGSGVQEGHQGSSDP